MKFNFNFLESITDSLKNDNLMDGESQNLETNPNGQPGNMVHDDRPVLQSVWFRYRTVLANPGNWQFMESQFRFVLHSGTILWLLFLLSISL